MILPVALITSLSLISCGGGGGGDDSDQGITYAGLKTEATVTVDNADDLAIAATGGASQAIASDNAPASIKSSPEIAVLLDLSSKLTRFMSSSHRTANQPVPDVCSSGSADFTSSSDGSSATMTFNNCVLIGGEGAVVDGVAKINIGSDGSFSVRYINFTMTYLGETYTLNMTISCDSAINCTWLSDYTGPDGRTYRVEGATVSGSGSSFTVTATVFDPDFGFITITGSVNYGSCPGGVPISGSITYSGSGSSSGSVTFNDCFSFTVDDGSTTVDYFWVDIL